MKTALNSVLAGLTVMLALTAPLLAGSRRPVTLEERLLGADRAVVARVARIKPAFEQNQWGDELIVSHVTLDVEETLKGGHAKQMELVVEGGSLNGLTLHVSDLPELKIGGRGVFFLKGAGTNRLEPHLRGEGILELDGTNHVAGSSLTLDTIRSTARSLGVVQ